MARTSNINNNSGNRKVNTTRSTSCSPDQTRHHARNNNYSYCHSNNNWYDEYTRHRQQLRSSSPSQSQNRQQSRSSPPTRSLHRHPRHQSPRKDEVDRQTPAYINPSMPHHLRKLTTECFLLNDNSKNNSRVTDNQYQG